MEILHGETNRMESCCLPYACVRCRVPFKFLLLLCYFYYLHFFWTAMVTPGFKIRSLDWYFLFIISETVYSLLFAGKQGQGTFIRHLSSSPNPTLHIYFPVCASYLCILYSIQAQLVTIGGMVMLQTFQVSCSIHAWILQLLLNTI